MGKTEQTAGRHPMGNTAPLVIALLQATIAAPIVGRASCSLFHHHTMIITSYFCSSLTSCWCRVSAIDCSPLVFQISQTNQYTLGRPKVN